MLMCMYLLYMSYTQYGLLSSLGFAVLANKDLTAKLIDFFPIEMLKFCWMNGK